MAVSMQITSSDRLIEGTVLNYSLWLVEVIEMVMSPNYSLSDWACPQEEHHLTLARKADIVPMKFMFLFHNPIVTLQWCSGDVAEHQLHSTNKVDGKVHSISLNVSKDGVYPSRSWGCGVSGEICAYLRFRQGMWEWEWACTVLDFHSGNVWSCIKCI